MPWCQRCNDRWFKVEQAQLGTLAHIGCVRHVIDFLQVAEHALIIIRAALDITGVMEMEMSVVFSTHTRSTLSILTGITGSVRNAKM
jgi:hypothetical protein